ncbi:SusC/RagA family TonB-linked outer membrane protein [Rapidithrix thailandica]|uniref:SusC/RagA family TonB-linked outer membrane protein n=1 Tax=Rapidithrix thailandica TaxID=413964 RepID=A0AAW9S3H7_9BACT
MKKVFTTCWFVTLCLWSTLSWAQNKVVKGTVTNETGEPIPGVSIVVTGTTKGTITTGEGKYTLQVPEDAVSLTFSSIGYMDMEEQIGQRSVIDVVLVENVTQLEEIVVTSFGRQEEKKSLGYSVQSFSSEDLQEAKQANFLDAMQGKVAGVNITSSGGTPGAGTNIIIRGITSLDPSASNQPLFVIDGIPIDNSTNAGSMLPSSGSNSAGSSEQFSFSNRAVDINPSDIESVNILKGPSATALYGLRGANGVVVITTKRGKAGKARINFSSSYSWDQVGKTPEVQSKYREGRFGRLRFNSDGSPLRFQTFGPKVSQYDPVINNMKEFWETGHRLDNSLSISGGNDNSTYYTSVSRLDQNGIAPNSEWNRTSIKLNGSTKFSDDLEVTGSMQYINSQGVRPNGGDKSIMSALSYYTTTYGTDNYVNPIDGTQVDYSDGITDNPRYLAEFANLEDEVNRVIANVGLNARFTNWLKLDYKVGIDQYTDKRRRIVPADADVGRQVKGFTIENKIQAREINSNLLLTAFAEFNEDLNMTVTAGNAITETWSESLNVRGEGFTLNNFKSIGNTTNYFTKINGSLRRLVGLFADVKFEYRDFLFLNLTGRNDWSSTLPKENRSFFYPSVSLGYLFSEHMNLQSNFFSYGKVRLSYAEVGKDTDPYLLGYYYEPSPGFPFESINGFRKDDTYGSDRLRPERTSAIEFGAELKFFNNRLGIDATYFQQRSKDQIIRLPVSNTTGLSRYITNAGEIENKGIELLITGEVIRSNNFNWSSSLNFSKTEGEILSMPEGLEEIVFFDGTYIQNKIVKGGKVGDLYGHKFNRNQQGQLIIDKNGLPSVNTEEYVKVGNAIPDWTAGLNNSISYKNFTLSVLLELKQGGDLFDMGLRNGIRNGVLKETELRYREVIFKGVTETGEPNTKPVEINGENLYRSYSRYNSASEVILQDASWFRIRNVNLSYNLPKQWIEKLKMQSARVSLTGNNLYLNTPYRGYDPEASQFGAGSNAFGFAGLVIPQTRSYTLSLNVTF